MATQQIEISEDLEVDRLAQEAGYPDAGAYVEALVLADRRRRATERLESLAQEGIASGPAIPADEAYWAELRAEAERRIVQVENAKSRE